MTNEGARLEIGRIAQGMLSGTISYLEGALEILRLSNAADLRSDKDVEPFILIESETDALPLGQVREHWHQSALEKLQPRIEEAEAWAREVGLSAAERLAARFSR